MITVLTPIEQYVVDFVRKLRIQKKHTQQDIATILNKDRSFISRIENPKLPEKYNMNHVALIADHYNISPKDFFPEKATVHKEAN